MLKKEQQKLVQKKEKYMYICCIQLSEYIVGLCSFQFSWFLVFVRSFVWSIYFSFVDAFVLMVELVIAARFSSTFNQSKLQFLWINISFLTLAKPMLTIKQSKCSTRTISNWRWTCLDKSKCYLFAYFSFETTHWQCVGMRTIFFFIPPSLLQFILFTN